MADETPVPATADSSNPEVPKEPAQAAPEKTDAVPVPALRPIELPAAEAPVSIPAEPLPPVTAPKPDTAPAPVPNEAQKSAEPETSKVDTGPVPAIVVPPKGVLPEASAQSSVDKLFGGNAVAEKAFIGSAEPAEKLVPVTERAEMRTLREVGIAERPETAKEAPERPSVAGEDAAREAGGARVVRTYAADMAEEIRRRGETLSTIVGAEQLKKETAPPPAPGRDEAERKGRIMLLIGAVVFVFVGIALVAGAVLLFTSPKTPSYTETTLIPANETVVLPHNAASSLANELAAERANAQMNLGEVENVPVSENGAAMSPEQILAALGAPDVLARNALDVMVGLHAFNRTQPFILIRVSAYDLAFQAMLAWEPTMARDLGTFFAPLGPTAAVRAPAPFLFSDRVSQNVDTRVSDASWPILYAFPQKDLLLITTNESTLKEVLSRLASGKSTN